MNEQQRLFLTLTVCMGIWLGWQYLTGGLEPPPQQAVEHAAQAGGSPVPAAPVAAAPPGAAPPAAPAKPAPALPSERRAFRTALIEGEVQDGDGALAQLSLPAFAPKVLDEDPSAAATGVSLLPQCPSCPQVIDQAGLHFQLASGPVPLKFVDASQLRLEGVAADGTLVRLRMVPQATSYAIDYEVEVVNATAQAQAIGAGLTLGLAPLGALEVERNKAAAAETGLVGYFKRSFAGSGPGTDRLRGLLAEGPKLVRKEFAAATTRSFASAQPVDWAAVDEQYFLLAWVPTDGQKARATLFTRDKTLGLTLAYPDALLQPQASWQAKFRVFAGPKRDQELAQVDPRLVESIDYTFLGIPLGFMARPMVWTLRTFHALTHSWGLSILLLTLVVKVLLLPVVYKSVTSMRRMQEIKPELDRLKERFANDKERQQTEQLKLFKERGVNPVSGCLPLLLQMPVWLTLYRTLWGAVDLYRQPFLWLTDLTAREPFPYLALLVGAVTYVQQKTTPMAVDNQQARVMAVMMPALVTVFMVNLPSGLVLYILANSVLTIVQQLVIHRRAGTLTKA